MHVMNPPVGGLFARRSAKPVRPAARLVDKHVQTTGQQLDVRLGPARFGAGEAQCGRQIREVKPGRVGRGRQKPCTGVLQQQPKTRNSAGHKHDDNQSGGALRS